MTGPVAFPNASHPDTGQARSPGSTPKPGRPGRPGPAASFPMVPDVTPCSSGTASSSRKRSLGVKTMKILKTVNQALAHSLEASFRVRPW